MILINKPKGGKTMKTKEEIIEIVDTFIKWQVDGIGGYLPYHYFTHWMPLPEPPKEQKP